MVGKLQVAPNGTPFNKEYIEEMDTPNKLHPDHWIDNNDYMIIWSYGHEIVKE